MKISKIKGVQIEAFLRGKKKSCHLLLQPVHLCLHLRQLLSGAAQLYRSIAVRTTGRQ